MDASMLISVIGLIATVILGVYALAVSYSNPCSITFFFNECLDLFNIQDGTIPELSVEYRGQPVGNGLVLLKGVLINTGRKDITDEMVKKELALLLPAGYVWKLVNLVLSDTLGRSANIVGDNSIQFKLGLFRRKELIKFEALAEVPTSELLKQGTTAKASSILLKNLSFHHRIADTDNVSVARIMPEDEARHTKKLSSPFIFIFIMSVIYIIYLSFIGGPKETKYYFVGDSGLRTEVSVTNVGSNVIITGVDSDYKNTIPLANYKIETETIEDLKTKIGYLVLCILAAFIGMIGVTWRAEARRSDKIRTLLELENN